jgi:hypothetical protein
LPLVVPSLAAAPAPVPVQPAPAPVAATPTVDAFLNMGNGSYPEAGFITTGNAQPWYQSAAITGFFGGTPTAQQQASFASTVLQRVEQTFQLSGVPVSLTTDQTVSAAHTVSLVSNTVAALIPNAIGMTDIGANGFSFIDQEAKSAKSLDQLEWIVAHNISHELMLSFGVGENFDQTGNFVDARNANLSMMTNPSATFSAAASQALNQNLLNQATSDPTAAQSAQVLHPGAVPEPGSFLVWGLGALAVTVRAVVRNGRTRSAT